MSALSPPPRLFSSPTWKWWALSLLGVVALIMATAFLHHHAPGESRWLPPCWFHAWTGLYCTGCGITRAAHALATGNLVVAWRMNPLAVLSIPALAALWLHRALSSPPSWQPWVDWLKDARIWAVVVIVFTVGRNLPWIPFSTWAPG